MLLKSARSTSFIKTKNFQSKKYFMPQVIIPLALAAAQAGYSAHKASQQRKKARSLKEANLVPKSVEEALANEKLRSTATSPEYLRGLEKLGQGSANTISQAKRIGGTAGLLQQQVADTDARKREGIKDLQIAEHGAKAQSRASVNELSLTKGGYEREARDQLDAAQSALRGAAEQNESAAVAAGLQGIAGVAGAASGGSKSAADVGNATAGGAGAFAGGGTFNTKARAFGGGTRLSTTKGLGSLNSSARGYGGGTRLSSMKGMSLNARRRVGLNQVSPYDLENDLMYRNYGYPR
jgi:hypothetical protein